MRMISLVALLWVAVVTNAAPGLNEKTKWQYAELSFRMIPARPGGVDDQGNEIPGTPASALIRWTTATDETEVKSWLELADALKTTVIKKNGTPTLQKIQILNYLGSEGWELVEQQTTGAGGAGVGRPTPGPTSASGTTVWMFKRRIP